ncbi:MAG: IS1595 family transposase [Rhodospirillales bacterium]|nr:IS1595 family transposase [Rhodospirillales bacterium]
MTTYYEFQKQFPDDDACLAHIMQVRYGGTELQCPKCERHGKFYRLTNQLGYSCQHCGHHIHPCAGTFLHRTHTPLHKWFFAMHLFSTSRHGVAAKELQRQLGVSYPTALRMAHLIRGHMAEVDGEHPLDGDVEADETYIGGRRRGYGRGYRKDRAVVFGMVERDGDVMAKVVPNVRKRTLQPIIEENVARGSTVHTDELRSYLSLAKAGYTHRTVNHSDDEYVDGDSHVNAVEGFWSRLKNAIRGTHVHVSAKHLAKYVKEFEYRYNRRKKPGRMFRELVAQF